MNTKKLKVLAMIILTSTLLILASAASFPSVKAATTSSLVVYTTLGGASSGAVMANGTAMVMGSAGNPLTTGDTYTFTATAASGYQFLGWAYADASGSAGTTSASYSKVISQACALEAVFVPTTNVTATPSGSGASTMSLFATEGGTTSPTGQLDGAAVSGTIGTAQTFTETPGDGYNFLCWVVQCGQNNYYTSSTLSYTPTSSGAAIEALWVPTDSGITLTSTTPTATPTSTVPEFSAAITVIIAAALVAAAFATIAISKKARK